MSTDTGIAFGWDEERIENPNEGGEFVTLTPGDYAFTVVKFERGRFEGSAKMCACPKAVLTLELDGNEFGTVKHTHNLYLNKKCEGMLCQFFACVGLRKHGEPLVLAWNQLAGRSGRCTMGNRVHNEKTYNDVKRFLDPTDATTTAAPAQTEMAGTEGEIPF